jgi:diguanylate cyclase (GGDEF)-like protein/PAS domain S-box-containing protein
MQAKTNSLGPDPCCSPEYSTLLNITGRAEVADALRCAFEASQDCIKLVSLDGRIEYMNAPGLRTMEIDDPESLVGRYWAALWPARATHHICTALERARAGHSHRFSDFCPTAKGSHRWWDVLVSPVRGEHGRVVSILAISRDITHERQSAEQLRWASEHDVLTELPNRRAFEAHLQSATAQALKSGVGVGLLLIDLDHFKHVNDTLGHAAGDHLLKVFTARLRRRLRASDFLARIGGDEFAVVVDRCSGDDELLCVGQALCDELNKTIRFEHRTIGGGCSIGGALFPRDAAEARDLLRNADIALYARKRAGRGGTQLFDARMREEAQLVASQLSLARRALSEKTVEPHYQQKVDLRTGTVAGFEALLRWRRARQYQKPETVEAAFKDYELASKIGELMQRKVFEDLRHWLDIGLQFGSVAINAAPAEFLRDDFAERMVELLQRFDIPPSLVEVEVTEHAFLDRGSAFVARALHKLHSCGVRIALDDFGTGHSSLSHLRDFPVDVVKIDKTFIGKITSDHEVRAIVAAVLDLARKLEIDAVAEGVENDVQRALLVSLGCPYGQGHLFALPVAAAQVVSLLRQPRSLVA